MVRWLVGTLAIASLPAAAWAEGGEAAPAPAPAVQGAGAEQAPPSSPKDLPFTPENVLAVVTLHAQELQRCYEEAMARRGSTVEDAPAGRVVVTWTITVQGLPRSVKVKESEIVDSTVTDCMVNAIRRWEFPRPDRPQPVEFPFDLEPIGGSQTLIGGRD